MTTPVSTIETEEVACNLCGSADSSVLYQVRDTLYGLPGEFTLHCCSECGLIYLNPRPTEQSILTYYLETYSSYHRPVADERFALMRWMRRRKLETRRQALERHAAARPGRILDVGCATGLFLQEMKRAGWQTAGVEPVETAARFARKRFDLEVFNGMLLDAPYGPGSFDAITFWDVLEHTFAPREEIARAAQLLRSGGLLAISVPNWDSWERRWFGQHWQGLDPPRHLYVFTPGTLERLLREAGFTLLDRLCLMPSYFSCIISLDRWLRTRHPRWAPDVRRLANIPGMRLLFEPVFGLANRLGKGSVVTLIARKEVR